MPTKAVEQGTEWLSLADSYGLDRRGRWIIVDQDRQVMAVGEGDSVIRTFPVSTGAPGRDGTPAWIGVVGKYWGTFEASDGSYADNAWYLFPHNGAILIHSAPYFMDDGHKEYQGLDALGRRPVSHGCVRMSPRDAEWFTKWDPRGVPILITPCNCNR
jgi:lipoprotein-anchoring transpeptidase ErfK/SrfK